MSTLSNEHRKLVNGVGRCSVPMWQAGCPAGFCDELAYGERPPGETFRNVATGEIQRWDGRYAGYVPGLACQAHGGPSRTGERQ